MTRVKIVLAGIAVAAAFLLSGCVLMFSEQYARAACHFLFFLIMVLPYRSER